MNDALTRRPQFFWRRTIILGSSILAAFVFIGIAMTFWREYGGSSFKMPAPAAYRLLIQATLRPVFMGIYFLWLITVPVMFVLTMMAYAGAQLVIGGGIRLNGTLLVMAGEAHGRRSL